MKMKKLLILIPLIALTGCDQPAETFIPYIGSLDGVPSIHLYEGSHTTYLMMSPFGYLDIAGAPVKGKVSEKFFENTIVWVADANTPLPSGDDVKSTVEGASFKGWAYYNEENDNVFPDYYTSVPAQSGLALKAIFAGTDAGGSGGEIPSEGFGLMFSDGKYLVASPTTENDGYQQYLISDAAFTVGQSFQIYDFANQIGWIVPIDPWSFGGDGATSTAWKKYLSDATGSYSVLTNFTASIYIKMKYGQDQIYFGLSN